jgi:hypothetical protein
MHSHNEEEGKKIVLRYLQTDCGIDEEKANAELKEYDDHIKDKICLDTSNILAEIPAEE